jgi:hypothetical protein
MRGSVSFRCVEAGAAPLVLVLAAACTQVDADGDGDGGAGGSGGEGSTTSGSPSTGSSPASSSTGGGVGGAPSSGDVLYALAWDPSNEVEHIVTIDAGTGSVTSVGQLPAQYTMFSDCVVDPASGRMYQSSDPSLVLTIDTTAATLVTAAPTSLPPDFVGFFPGGVNGAGEILGHAWDMSLSREHIVQLDPMTGMVTSLGTLPPAHTAFTGALYDHATDRLYTLSNEGTDVSILRFEANGTYIGATPLVMGPYINLSGATVNGAGEVIGLVWDNTNDVEHVVKVDADTGTITSTGTLPPSYTTFSVAKGVYYAASDRIYLLDSAGPAEIFAIDASSGAFLGATPLASNGFVNPICLQAPL